MKPFRMTLGRWGRRFAPVTALTAALPMLPGALGWAGISFCWVRDAVAGTPHTKADDDDMPLEPAKTSRVSGLPLPAGGFRILKQDLIEEMWKPLRTNAEENGLVTGRPEGIIWTDKNYNPARADQLQKEIIATFKKNGFQYEKVTEKEEDGGKLTIFVVGKPEAKEGIFGFFLPQKTGFLVAMSKIAKKGTPLSDDATTPATSRPSGGGDKLPAAEQARVDKALGEAVEAKDADAVNSLLAKGANPNANNKKAGLQSFLQRAVMWRNTDMAAALLEAGADPNYGDGDTLSPLYTAAMTGNVEMVDLLLEKGANVNARTAADGRTALHGAAITGTAEVIQHLLAKGADATLKDKSGRTPLQVAEAAKNSAAAEALRDAGDVAKPEAPATSATDETPDRPTPAPAAAAPAGAIVIDVAPRVKNVNVMKNAMPKAPAFPSLSKKPGYVRGYVYDANGRPLKGALIGVRSTAAGGFYSGASSRSDAKGYYEIQVPFGVAHFYAAGYAVPYGEGKAALGLHPVNQDDPTFASNVGAVQNFMLVGYGIADPDHLQDSPHYSGNYYGGTFCLGWWADDDAPTNLPKNAKVEVTLTPEGPLADGSKGRPIVLRINSQDSPLSYQLWVNNIPVGTYKISARLVNGGPLKMKETGPYANQMFGLEGKQVVGTGTLTFRPGSADPNMATSGHGNWTELDINLERP